MASDRNENRSLYLQALDQRSAADPYGYWEPNQLVEGFSDAEIQDAIRYLEEKGFIEALHAAGDRGLSAARITAYGQDFLSNAEAYRSDPTLGAFANATIHINTTHINQSTVGNLASGGSGSTFSGTLTIINNPQADALREAFQRLDAALAGDTTLPPHVKEEVGDQVQVVRAELAKPSDEQSREKITHRWERVSSLVATVPSIVEIVASITKLLVAAHGGAGG